MDPDDFAPITLDDPERYFARLDAFEASHWWPRAMRKIVLELVGRAIAGRSGVVAVDVGCGTGRLLGGLAAIPGVEAVLGIEPEPTAVARVDPRFSAIRASALNLPLREASVDVVCCLDVVQHLSPGGAERAFAEFARVLRAGGIAVVRGNAERRSGGLAGLRSRAREAGFELETATHLNMIPGAASELVAWLGRIQRGAGVGSPEGAGLPRESARGGGSRLLGWIAEGEARAVARWGVVLPWGHGSLITARKPRIDVDEKGPRG
ncbi:MAG: class I SAM-dependent methyltransferase [Isosphaeraceae bacterium]|nr:class I SAM-dependent methyltransferase [Isosphaeraceae bacterium]